jgi:hypothetical protein
MANPTIHVLPNGAVDADAASARQEPVARRLAALYREFAAPQDGNAQAPLAFLSRFVVLQGVGAAAIAGLWLSGLAARPFEGSTAPLCWIIVAMGALGLIAVFFQRWHDAQWLATHVVRIGLLGTVVGLIIAFSAAAGGNTSNPEDIKPMIAAVVSGMYVSLYATLLGIGTNLWLKINLRLLGNHHG